jgi:hypothetical protein
MELIAATSRAGKLVKACTVSRDDPVELLVHDGKRIVVRHGPGQTTGCGDPACTMLKGTKAEIDALKTRLGLVDGTEPPAKVDAEPIKEAPAEELKSP